MAYPLTVNRVMGLCAFEQSADRDASESLRDTKEVAKDFYRQMEEICRTQLEQIYGAIKRRAEGMQIRLADQEIDTDDLEVTIIQDNGQDRDFVQLFPTPKDQSNVEPPRDPIIGLFRSRRFVMTVGERAWDLRVRPSVTACVLERRDRLSKLWWTFEGVPVDASDAPNEKDSVQFVEVTTRLAEDSLPDLRAAYTATLESVTGESHGAHRMSHSQLRVSFADNTDSRFSRLVDAMNLSGVTFKDAIAETGTDLRAGADEVANFVAKTSGQAADPSEILLSTAHGGLAAIYTRPVLELDAPADKPKYIISGLASSIGMISNSQSIDPAWTRITSTPDLVRSISAARPLSARIADIGARQLEPQSQHG